MDKIFFKGDYIEASKFHGFYVYEFLNVLDKLLKKGDRVELIPVKDGIKVMRVRREEITEKYLQVSNKSGKI